MTEEVVPWKIFLQVVQLLSNTWIVGHVLDRTDRQYTVELPIRNNNTL